MTEDEKHLNLLSTFHYIVAALGAMFACLPLLHVGLGLVFLLSPESIEVEARGAPPPPWIGYIFIVMGGLFVLLGWAAAICTFLSGRYLARREKRTFSFVVAALLCMAPPFGTVLGIFTIIVLSRESVQRLYAAATPASQAGGIPPVLPIRGG